MNVPAWAEIVLMVTVVLSMAAWLISQMVAEHEARSGCEAEVDEAEHDVVASIATEALRERES